MKLLQYLLSHREWDHETTTVHNETVINSQLAADTPIPLALFWQLISVLRESIEDVMLELLVFLIGFGVLPQVIKAYAA